MKRIFALFCAIALVAAGFPALGVSATENAQVQWETWEPFPDLRQNEQAVKLSERNFPSGFMDYLKEQMGNCETAFSIEQFSFPYDRWEELKNVIWYATPELFHVISLGYSYSGNGIITGIRASYSTYADTKEEYQTCLAKMIAGAEYLLQGVKGNDDLTQLEKALILHDRLAVWNEYDLDALSDMDIYQRPSFGAYGALGEATSVCQGYAMAYMYLLQQVGIKSDYCSSQTLNHGWNIVYIDGVAYHVDVTWDDPINGYSGPYTDTYGNVQHTNFLRSSAGIWDTGHEANDYDTTPNDSRYDSKSSASWWRTSDTAVQLIGDKLYYLDNSLAEVICADNGSTVYSYDNAWYSFYYRLSGVGRMLLCSNDDTVQLINPVTGAASVVYTVQNGRIEGMKYENGKLYLEIDDGDGNISRQSIAYTLPEGEAVPGDFTGEGLVNSADGLLLLRWLNGWKLAVAQENILDVSGDGKVDSMDGLLLMRKLNGWNVTLQ